MNNTGKLKTLLLTNPEASVIFGYNLSLLLTYVWFI